jgi:Heterokaryon incompatibility protein (HET)
MPLTLPRAFTDAIELANELGLRYLWIDALCIVQDDVDDISFQIANMASVYACARVCIVGAAGEDVEAGLPGASSSRPKLEVKCCRMGEDLFLGRAAATVSSVLEKTRWNFALGHTKNSCYHKMLDLYK